MSFAFLDATARSTWAAGTSEQGQLEALAALWSGNVEVEIKAANGTTLTTVLHDGLSINTATDPRRAYLGAYVSENKSADGTASYAILSLPGSTDILRCDVSLAGQILSTNGRTNLADLAPGGLVILATASLPAGGAPGTITTIGTQTLNDYLADVRTAMAEGLTAADARMQTRSTVLAYCGATLWQGKYALPIFGGHGDSFDDGGYAQDLTTGAWETLIAPSTIGTSVVTLDTATGEWTGATTGRPASQHTLQHLIAVGDDMIQANTSYAGVLAQGSRQAHRWNYSTGLWQRYGDNGGGVSANDGCYCHYDAARNRLVRINLAGVYGKLDTIAADNAGATWTSVTIGGAGIVEHEIGASIGYHEDLDCYVLISPGDFTPRNTIYVMDPDALTTGWVSVSVSGDNLPSIGNTGLEYCPPLGAMVTVDPSVGNKLMYATPTGAMTDPWVWSSEVFTGTAETWEGYPSGNYNGVYRRFVWAPALGGFVMLKKASALTELYVPTT